MYGILALSSRHLSLSRDNQDPCARTAATQYYHETLCYLQKAMHYETYTTSSELLATVMVISTYEALCDSGQGWGRHLKGVFEIQNAQVINGESGGIKESVWWNWLRQDIWAAFRQRRRTYACWTPTRPLRSLGPYELVRRSMYLLSRAVNYCSDEESRSGEVDLQRRIDGYETLSRMLNEWQQHISIEFDPLPSVLSPADSFFPPLYIQPHAFGTS